MADKAVSKEGQKKQSDVAVMLKEAAILFVITLVSGFLLGFVYDLTKEPIRVQQEKAVQEACMAVFPGSAEMGVSFEELQYTPDALLVTEFSEKGVEIGSVFKATDNTGALYGYVVQSTTSEGYGGDIVLYVGVKADTTVSGVSILDISETAGLGMEASNVLVPQFADKAVTSFTYSKTGSRSESEVDAISGATITTDAVVDAVNGGIKAAQKLLQGGGVNE